jgi:transcriptional regulator with XRE-family HTH domain
MLREYRTAAGITQTALSERLGRAQSVSSDVERGQRRLDVVQLRDILIILGQTLPEMVQDFEQRIARQRR